jgi:5-methylcytosine-specific restriction endonuclease McrA
MTQGEIFLLKAAVRKRDRMRCTECGMSNRRHKTRYGGKSLHVHRLTPGSAYTLAGCVTLCIACHGLMPKRLPGSRDKTRNMVRLPDDLHQAMKDLARSNGRPLTWEVRQALAAWLRAKGKEPPTP